ncbi:GTP-binding protein Rit2, partial [Chelonia mydas]
EDAYKTQVRIDDEPAYLDILDTAGQAEFTAMRDQYMRGGEGFIICYSITDRQSFQEAAEFKELIYRVRHTYDIPLVLVGNKIDLEEFRQASPDYCKFVCGSCGITPQAYGVDVALVMRVLDERPLNLLSGRQMSTG